MAVKLVTQLHCAHVLVMLSLAEACTNPRADTRPNACARVADCTIGFTREMSPGVDAEALYGGMRTLPYGPADEPRCVDVVTRLRMELLARDGSPLEGTRAADADACFVSTRTSLGVRARGSRPLPAAEPSTRSRSKPVSPPSRPRRSTRLPVLDIDLVPVGVVSTAADLA